MAETPRNDEESEVLEGRAENVEISDPEPAGEAPPRRAVPWKLAGLAALILVLAAIAAFAVLRPDAVQRALGIAPETPTAERAAVEDRLARLAQDLATVRSRVVALEARVETADGGGGAQARQQIAALADRVAALEGESRTLAERMAAAEKGGGAANADAATAAESALSLARKQQTALAEREREIAALKTENQRLNAAVSGLAERMAAMEKQAPAGRAVPGRTAALVLAAGQLRSALSEARPFTAELASLRALAGNDAAVSRALETLAPLAPEGVPTLRMLVERFDPMAREVVRAGIAGGDGGLVDRALSRLAGLVTVRPVGGDVEGDSPSAVLARAEARLAAGDLAGAVESLAALQGAPAEAAARWLADARARLAADAAADALSRHAIGRMAEAAPAPEAAGPGQR